VELQAGGGRLERRHHPLHSGGARESYRACGLRSKDGVADKFKPTES